MSSTEADVWAHFGEGGALSVDVVSRTEAEELSVRVAELEDEVGIIHVCIRLISLSTLNPRAHCRDITRLSSSSRRSDGIGVPCIVHSRLVELEVFTEVSSQLNNTFSHTCPHSSYGRMRI